MPLGTLEGLMGMSSFGIKSVEGENGRDKGACGGWVASCMV